MSIHDDPAILEMCREIRGHTYPYEYRPDPIAMLRPKRPVEQCIPDQAATHDEAKP